MTDLHGSRDDLFDQIHSVVVAQSNGELTHERFARFDRLLADSKTARQLYVEYIYESLALPLMLAMGEEEQVLPSFANIEQDISEPQILPSVAAAIPDQSPESRRDNSNPPPLFPAFLSTAYHGTMGFLSQELPFSLFIATVMTGLGLWVASLIYVSRPEQMTQSGSRLPLAQSAFDPTLEVVGKITGMADCKWSKDGRAPSGYDNVLVGRQFTLDSGLMEITYDTGAKVILQGPVTYKVDSRDGGFLAVGKLTARLEKKVAISPNLSSLSTIHYPLFTIHTPTATVTDLGTEFGVEVNALGDTETHVFAGKVELAGRDRRGRNVAKQMLVAGQTARLDANTATVTIQRSNAKRFVQQMPPSRQADHSGLIGQIDYSDTWTVNSLSRRGNNVLLVDANLLRVENCPGNPPRSWKFSTPTSVTARPSEGASQFWPGYQVHGCGSGFTEAIARECYFGLEYGLRDDFIVQFDAVQVRDRINLTVSDTVATFQCGNSLSVFIRASTTPLPEIALLASSKGPEIDTGLHSGIVTPHQWHNYAVRFNLREKTLTVWVDRRPCGTIRLATITRGMQTGSWADLPFTNRYVTVGGANGGPTDYIWTDNFCIGTPAQAATQIEQPQTTTSIPREN